MKTFLKKDKENLFSHLKEAYMLTFQCSPLSQSDMILNTFRLCAQFQFVKCEDLDRYVSVVVLDEIGLAEASPSMPLKTLHPLLEEGVYFDEKTEIELKEKLKSKWEKNNKVINDYEWRKVSFIGISNWVLDPAKMNRGIFVNRCLPDEEELGEIARGICKNNEKVLQALGRYLPSIARGYMNLCEEAKAKREFFGLRDFYSLIKMIYYEFKCGRTLDFNFWYKAIRRNFGGLASLDPIKPFMVEFKEKNLIKEVNAITNVTVIQLIKEALCSRKNDIKTVEGENRYLLLLSQNESALDLLIDYVIEDVDKVNQKIIFGSSFPNDQHYSQLYRQIRQVKLSMESGKTVVLLNLENIYESLYDALNQFFYRFGENEKYVDLGLGTQRVKCLVHDDFRLIVIAPKKYVYDSTKFPIPLINRLEKHILTVESILSSRKMDVVKRIREWCDAIANISTHNSKNATIRHQINKKTSSLKAPDIFIGFTDDTIASLVLKVCKTENYDEADEYVWQDGVQNIIEKSKECLLRCAAADSIVRLDTKMNSNNQNLESILQILGENEIVKIIDIYFKNQRHNSFDQFLKWILNEPTEEHLIQISTHSKLLSRTYLQAFQKKNENEKFSIKCESLIMFNSQKDFLAFLNEFLETPKRLDVKNFLIIQCECANLYTDLISCARYTINDCLDQYLATRELNALQNIFIILLIQVPKISGGCFYGFQTSKWLCYHIDDLQDDINLGNIYSYKDKTLSEVLSDVYNEIDNTDKSFSSLSRVPNSHISILGVLESTIYDVCSKVVDIVRVHNRQQAIDRPRIGESGDTNLLTNRCIKRIKILNKLFSEKISSPFILTLVKIMMKLQREKELETSTDQLSRSWIYNEVSNMKNIIRFGTLKTSCREFIEKKLSVLLAGIISFTDTNNNLDILEANRGHSEWIENFWFDMFNNDNFIKLDYSRFFLNANREEKIEFNCIDYFLKRIYTEFKLMLPFSWLIIEFVDELIKLQRHNLNSDFNQMQVADVNSNTTQIFSQILNVFRNSLQYKSLIDITTNANRHELYDFYLNDFLLISYPEIVDAAHFLITKKRITKYIQQYYTKDFLNIDAWLAIHLAFDNLHKELILLAQFIQFRPELAAILEKNEVFEYNLSYLAANIVCKSTAASLTSDNTSNIQIENWNKLFNDAENSSFLIDAFIKQFYNNSENSSSDDLMNEKFKKFKSLWERVTISKLFIEHVCTDFSKDMYTFCTRLWNYLKDPIDFKSSRTVEQFIQYINSISFNRKRLYEKELKTCKGCNIKSNELYKSKTCEDCLLCKECVKKFRETKKCDGCNRKFENFNFELIIDATKHKNDYLAFKSNLDKFFLDAVCTMCLNDDYLPDKAIISMLINQIMPKTKEQLKANNGANVITMHIADVDLELDTTIRSTLLQLMLKYDINDIVANLNSLFSQSAELLKTNYRNEDLNNLNLMYLNAIEDNFYAHEISDDNNNVNNLEQDARLAIEFLHVLLTIIDEKQAEVDGTESHINNLIILARIKFCLVTVSKLISLKYYTDFSELFNLTKKFVENYPNEWPRFFLIKQIFRRRGHQALLGIVSNDVLKWILPKNFSLGEENVSVGSSTVS